MANQDSFIDEVNEELRRDRLFALFRRYGWIAILAIVLIVGGAAFNEWRKASARADAEARGDAILAALSEDDSEARRADLSAVEAGDNPDTEAFLQLLAAAVDLEDRNTIAASDTLRNVTEGAVISAVYRDLAILKSMIAGAGDIPPEERISQLQGLALPGAPFRLLAQEQIALAEIERGNVDTAVEQLSLIAEDMTASQGLRNRAVQMIVALGVSPAN